MNFAHIVLVIGKYTDVSRAIFLVSGGGRGSDSGVSWMDLSTEEFIIWGRIFRSMEFWILLDFPALFKKKQN